MESKIEKLDYVLELVLKINGFVIANDLYNSKFYNDNGIMESEFLEMVLEFKRLGVADVVNYGKGLRKNEFTDGFKKDGGFASHYKKEKEIKTINKRKNSNISFEYFFKRPYYLLLLIILVLGFFGLDKCSKKDSNSLEPNKNDRALLEQNKLQYKNKLDSINKIKQKEFSLTEKDSTELKTELPK